MTREAPNRDERQPTRGETALKQAIIESHGRYGLEAWRCIRLIRLFRLESA